MDIHSRRIGTARIRVRVTVAATDREIVHAAHPHGFVAGAVLLGHPQHAIAHGNGADLVAGAAAPVADAPVRARRVAVALTLAPGLVLGVVRAVSLVFRAAFRVSVPAGSKR